MVKYTYNQPYYEILFSEVPKDTLRVLSFKGEDHISRLFKYGIDLVSDDPEIDPSTILNKKATFVLNRGDEDPINIHGIVSRFEQRGRTPAYVFYHAELVPKLWRLELSYSSKIFQKIDIPKMDVEKIISQVLKDANFSGEDFKFDLKKSYPELEYIVQYRETDLNFVNRRLEHFGVFYYFDHSGDNDVIVFIDENNSIPAIDQAEDIYYNPNKDPLREKETITEWTCQEKVVTGLVRLKDYNYLTPTRDLSVESQIDTEAPGTYYEYGDHFKDSTEGDFLAKVRNEEILANSKIFKGKGDCRLFRAGFKFKMGLHYRDEWNDTEFILTKVISQGTQRPLFNLLPDAKKIIPTYENHFDAIPIDIKYRPPRITPIPRIPGIMTAKLESGSGDEYAFIDEEGRYKMKAFFDLSDRGNGEASRPVRLSQPYSGPGYGVHLPNHADAELVWSCVDGNVDRPLGLGTVPNPSQASPSIADNKSQNIIRTASGNEIVMDDKTEEAQIGITTPDANKMLFDDKDDKIEVSTTQKHTVTMDDKNKNITVQTAEGHLIILDDENTKITVQSKNGHRISINDTGGSENITLVDADEANMFVIDISNNKLVIMTNDGDIDMHAPNGTIDIKATTFNLETSGDTIIKADANINTEAGGDYDIKAGGNVTEEATGDLKQSGTNVSSEAMMDHKINGTNVSSEASMEQKSTGMNVTVEGSVNNQIKGGMVTVQATGPNTIKGMPVMIN